MQWRAIWSTKRTRTIALARLIKSNPKKQQRQKNDDVKVYLPSSRENQISSCRPRMNSQYQNMYIFPSTEKDQLLSKKWQHKYGQFRNMVSSSDFSIRMYKLLVVGNYFKDNKQEVYRIDVCEVIDKIFLFCLYRQSTIFVSDWL